MPSRVFKTSVSIDIDLIEPAREKSRQFDRFGEVNLSAYINSLIRKDLGIKRQGESDGGSSSPNRKGPNPSTKRFRNNAHNSL